jgi:hypothetical protein
MAWGMCCRVCLLLAWARRHFSCQHAAVLNVHVHGLAAGTEDSDTDARRIRFSRQAMLRACRVAPRAGATASGRWVAVGAFWFLRGRGGSMRCEMPVDGGLAAGLGAGSPARSSRAILRCCVISFRDERRHVCLVSCHRCFLLRCNTRCLRKLSH